MDNQTYIELETLRLLVQKRVWHKQIGRSGKRNGQQAERIYVKISLLAELFELIPKKLFQKTR